MIDFLNAGTAILTIAFGLFGFLAPRFTAGALELETQGDSTMGLSEMRASAGGLFVALGTVCLLWSDPMAYVMLGVAYTGAATGRLVSLAIDKPPFPKAFLYFVIEAALAAWCVIGNI